MKYNILNNVEPRTVAVDGPLTIDEQTAFLNMLNTLFAEDSPLYVIDLAAVRYIDSAGLGFLLLARQRAEEKDTSVVLRRPTEDVRRTLELTKFNELFTIES